MSRTATIRIWDKTPTNKGIEMEQGGFSNLEILEAMEASQYALAMMVTNSNVLEAQKLLCDIRNRQHGTGSAPNQINT